MSQASVILARVDAEKTASVTAAVKALDALEGAAFQPARVHVLRNFTLEPWEPWLKLEAYRRGLRLDVAFGGFDTYRQDALSGDFNDADAVVVSLAIENVREAWHPQLSGAVAVDYVKQVLGALRERTRGALFLTTFLSPLGLPLSDEDKDELDEANRALRLLAKEDQRVFLVDVDRIAQDLGRSRALDPRYWFMHQAPWARPLLAATAAPLTQRLAASAGNVRKVLVLDADGTLWGGVVGEDGPSRIRLSAHEHPGNAFVAFQRRVLALAKRGVLLAIASKNEPEDVLDVLDAHPAMVLRREHFAALRIGWSSKVDGLRAIAEELRLGLDAFVFVDDSPLECALVREALPMVEVLQVPANAHELPALLDGYLGFVGTGSSSEDARRTDHYAAERKRDEARTTTTDLPAFLASLELRVTIDEPLPAELGRLAQLAERTNQFNLTTRRHPLGALEAFASGPDALVLALTAADRFGEYGLTGFAVAVREQDAIRIDSFLLSCRILGRGLEDALLAELMVRARERFGAGALVGEFVPSAKNRQTKEFFPRRGFVVKDESSSRTLFVLDAKARPIHPAHVQVSRRP